MYQALTLVAQSKTQGITTISLTDVMGLDPKTIHYFTKSLLGWGLMLAFPLLSFVLLSSPRF